MFNISRYLAVLILLVPTSTIAQNKIPVFISAAPTDDDFAGRQYVFAVKEAVRGARGYRLVDDSKQWPYIKLAIASVKTAAGTAVGYTLLYDSTDMPLGGAYIFGGVHTCPLTEIDSCARTAMARIDQAAERLQTDAPHLRKTLAPVSH